MATYGADFWAANAEQCRKIAASMRNEDARKGMLTAAARCEELANITRRSSRSPQRVEIFSLLDRVEPRKEVKALSGLN